MNAIVPRETVKDIVARRDRALALYEHAYGLLAQADEAVKAAHEAAQSAHPGVNSFTYSQAEEVKAFNTRSSSSSRTAS